MSNRLEQLTQSFIGLSSVLGAPAHVLSIGGLLNLSFYRKEAVI